MVFELITKALVENNIRLLSIIPRCLWNETDIKYIKFIEEFTVKYGQSPTFEVFNKEFRDFKCSPEDVEKHPTQYILDTAVEKLQTDYMRQQMVDRQEESKRNSDISLYDRDFLLELASKVKIADISAITYSEFNREEYFTENSEILSWGLPFLDEQLGGLTAGDLVYFFGRMKSNKTTFLLICQLAMMKQGLKVLVCSNEMTNKQLVQKNDAMLGGFNPMVFRTREWTDEIKDKIRRSKDLIKETGGDIHFAGSVNSPADVLAEINKCPFKPDVVMIDGANKMGRVGATSSEHSLSQKAVCDGLALLAINQSVPIVAVTHAKRGSGKATNLDVDDVAHSDELAKACTGLVGFAQEEHDGETYVKINVAANRFGDEGNCIFAKIDWDTMKVTFHESEMTDASFTISNMDILLNEVKLTNSLKTLKSSISKNSKNYHKDFIEYQSVENTVLLIELNDTLFLAYIKAGKVEDIIKLNDGKMPLGEVNVDDVIELEQDGRLKLFMVKSNVFNVESSESEVHSNTGE